MKLVDLFENSLQEVSMSPSNLLAFAQSPQAQNILVGFEAELVVPIDGGLGDDAPEAEPDYDQNERAWDIEQIVHFFQQGDYGMGRTEANRLHDQLTESWDEYLDEKVYQASMRRAEQMIIDLAQKDGMNQSQILDMLTNQDQAYQSYYETVLDELRDEIGTETDEQQWLRANGWRSMRDIEQAFDLTWPYVRYTDSNPDAVYEVARDIGSDLGIRVEASAGYHTVSRQPGSWVLEPDSSIKTPDDTQYGGLELITPSPPFPIAESLEWMDRVFEWAREYGCITNKSTGFHISVSLAGQTTENIDWIKLVLFLGDQHVLELFHRQANSFTVSAIKRWQEQVRTNPDFPSAAALDAMKKGLMTLAGQLVGRPSQDKYTSVNVKTNYVEFRSAGGNYLANQQQIKNTMLRYVRALVIAADPQAEKKEYATKLYKLLNPSGMTTSNAAINLFSLYSSGVIDKQALQASLKELPRGKEKG